MMAEPNRMKVRTAIVVVSMIVLPLAAVIGFKMPGVLRSERSWNREPAPTNLARKSAGNQTAPRPVSPPILSPIGPQSPPNATPDDKVQPKQPDYPVVRVGNIDVPPAVEPEVRTLGNPEPAAPAATDPFRHVQQRLRALGAVHYSLETLGLTGEAYRFQCRMAAGHDPNYARHFEATGSDPLVVMCTVLEQVEAWKAGRLP
jgi:hypothetical protein